MNEQVVTRFAPSPTGFMHIGSVRTALFAYLWARKNNGTFILRIEDTDKEREVAGSIEHIQESLRWLHIDWDYGPDKPGTFGSCIQSQRLEGYRVAAQELVNRGLAYPDPYTREEIDQFRAQAEAAKRPLLMRDHRPSSFGIWDGTAPLRFKVPEIKRFKWHDEVRGDLESGEEALDDFILMKTDGYPTYNFAHIIDDRDMGITHVFRGDEFISSTPRFLSLYEGLGIEPPKFVTLPPILRDDKTKKLGKRDGAKDILEYRAEGYLPEAMTNFLALIGWNPGTEQEIFSTEKLLQAFDVSQIQTHGGVFNEEKLRWFNRQYILNLPDSEFVQYALPTLREEILLRNLSWDERVAKQLILVLKDHMAVTEDLREGVRQGEWDFWFVDPLLELAHIPDKKSDVAQTSKHLQVVRDALSDLNNFSQEDIRDALWEYATQEGRGKVLWPLRYALTGRDKSPDPFVVAAIIGKESTIRRIDTALSILDSV